MPNLCCFEMNVQGTKERVENFIKVIKANYDYNSDTCECDYDRHLFRVFEADVFSDTINESNIRTIEIVGQCAWSVYSCMCEGGSTYYNDFKTEKGFKGTTLQKESALGLAIQVYSEESGCAFQEHFVYVNGETIAEECIDWEENYIDNEDDLAEYNKSHGTSYTMQYIEEHDNSLPEGGFENQEFKDYSVELLSA